MRLAILATLLSLIGPVAVTADDAQPSVQAYQADEIQLTDAARKKMADWAVAFLKTANFNTVNQPDILKQSVQVVHEHYRATVRKSYVVVTFSQPITVKTVGGNVVAQEIVVGLNRKDEWPSALFTVDADGRVVAHEKYGAKLPPELQPQAAGGAR